MYVILSLCLTWILDRVSKLLMFNVYQRNFFGIVGIVPYRNHGALLGMFSHVPPILRVVSLSTGGAFLLFLYGIFQFLIPTRSMMLRIGLSLLMGGIIGNVADRTVWGYVVDFLVIGTPTFHSPSFNFADAIQWVGYGLLIAAFVREGKQMWPSSDTRKKYWVKPWFQLKYCFILVLCGLGLTLILGVYSYTYLSFAIREAHPIQIQDRSFIEAFAYTFGIVSLTFCAVLFVVGLVLSHRAAGPLYAFEKFLDQYLEGKTPTLRLRAGDEFRELEGLARRLNEKTQAEAKKEKSNLESLHSRSG